MNNLRSDLTPAPSETAGGQVLYEVTLDVERRAAKRFDAWLKQHMREMQALPGFLAARLLPPEEAGAAPDARRVRRMVQYRLASRADLENYLSQHAARMRAESARYFGKQVHTSRRLLDGDGRELVFGQEVAAAMAQPTLRCLNCNTPLAGKFCVECGQPNHSYAAPLWADIQDFFGNHFGFDTKFFRSVTPLLFRPGFLTREYSAGRRVRYINPLRLYIFSSLLFFFIAWSLAPPQLFHFDDDHVTAPKAPASKSLTSAEQREIRDNPYLSAQQKQAILDGRIEQKSKTANKAGSTEGRIGSNFKIGPAAAPDITVSSTDNGNNNISGTLLGRKFSIPKREFEARIAHAMESNLPKLMFVFLPLAALLLKLFYLRSRRYYMEHLIFTLHNHAFVFSAMLVMLLLNLLGRHLAWAATPTHYFNVIIGWYIVVYIFLAMLFYYRQSFLKTLGKYLVIGGIYWICLLSVFVLGVVLIFAEVVAA